MASKGASAALLEQKAEMDMTPMIDVVFLLIIFFMIVTDLSQADIEHMTLPTADQAKEDKDPEKSRKTVNIMEDGTVRISGEVMSGERLAAWIRVIAQSDWNEAGQWSERAVIIRADEMTKYNQVQKVLQELAKEGIYKIEIAAKKPPGG